MSLFSQSILFVLFSQKSAYLYLSILLSHKKNSCALVRGSQKKRTLRFKYSQACLWNSFNFLGFKDPNPQNLRILMVNHVWSLHCRGFCEPPNKFKVQLHIREGIHKGREGIQKWLSLQHMNKNKIMTSKEVTSKREFFFLLYHFLTTHSGQVGGMKCQREDKLIVAQLGELMWCQTVNVVIE